MAVNDKTPSMTLESNSSPAAPAKDTLLQSPQKAQVQAQPRRNDSTNDSKVLKLKGLPYTTSEQQVLDFFAGYNVSEVAFVYEPDGRPSGLAFAEFATREEALQALSKNGEYLGDRYVRLLHVPKQEMEEQVRLGTLAIPGAQAKMRQKIMHSNGAVDRMAAYRADHLQMHGGMLQGAQQAVAEHATGTAFHTPLPTLLQGMPHSMAQPGIRHALTSVSLGMPPGTGMGGPNMVLPSMMPSGIAADQHMPLQVAAAPGGMLGGMAGVPPHMALAYQLSGMSLSGPAARPSNGSMSMVQLMPHAYAPAATAAPAMAVIGTDSKTIKIRGLPFRATPLDIFNFFENYDVIAESLQLGVDALGRPSGEAWLTFTSSEEALRAVRERNRHYLGNRYLELSLT